MKIRRSSRTTDIRRGIEDAKADLDIATPPVSIETIRAETRAYRLAYRRTLVNRAAKAFQEMSPDWNGRFDW